MASAGAGTDRNPAPLVTGRIVIPAAVPPFRGATAYLSLEDVSYADAPATVLAEAAIPDVRHQPTARAGEATVLAFTLRPAPGAAAIDPGNDYAVRAWIDLDGDGRIGPGDPASDQRYPVLTRGFGRTVTITLGAR